MACIHTSSHAAFAQRFAVILMLSLSKLSMVCMQTFFHASIVDLHAVVGAQVISVFALIHC